jgi:hypothetical protein
MRRLQHLIAAVLLIAASGTLAGCAGGFGSFDPTDMLDFLDTKKKLPGERKPVFPEGVPGLDQGVPKELYRGSRQQQADDPNAQAAAAPAPEASKRGPNAKGKSAPATAAADPDAAPEENASPAAPPPPKPARIVRKRTTAPPPDQPAPPQQSAAPFPAPMPSGTFTR